MGYKIRITALLLIFPLLLQGQTAVKIDSCGLKNMYRIDKDVYRSEQPDAEHFVALEKYGIREILNLRYWHSDEAKMWQTSIKARHVRMKAHDADHRAIVKALKIIANRKGAILIHCHHGSDRTGLIVAMYRLVFQNWSKKDAINEMLSDKFGFHKIYKNLVRYIELADIEQIKADF
ncbi:MAG: tyrosine-protein phosphatase [Prevotellaceae bacterium]|jgi:protein tyrosine/serine phosphatase|nr:tyrosine-protein phosphatase [Prevotellaceae bacterium]